MALPDIIFASIAFTIEMAWFGGTTRAPQAMAVAWIRLDGGGILPGVGTGAPLLSTSAGDDLGLAGLEDIGMALMGVATALWDPPVR